MTTITMMTITVIMMLIIKTNYENITSIKHNNIDNNNNENINENNNNINKNNNPCPCLSALCPRYNQCLDQS